MGWLPTFFAYIHKSQQYHFVGKPEWGLFTEENIRTMSQTLDGSLAVVLNILREMSYEGTPYANAGLDTLAERLQSKNFDIKKLYTESIFDLQTKYPITVAHNDFRMENLCFLEVWRAIYKNYTLLFYLLLIYILKRENFLI